MTNLCIEAPSAIDCTRNRQETNIYDASRMARRGQMEVFLGVAKNVAASDPEERDSVILNEGLHA